MQRIQALEANAQTHLESAADVRVKLGLEAAQRGREAAEEQKLLHCALREFHGLHLALSHLPGL